jgi:hypothetical protein
MTNYKGMELEKARSMMAKEGLDSVLYDKELKLYVYKNRILEAIFRLDYCCGSFTIE